MPIAAVECSSRSHSGRPTTRDRKDIPAVLLDAARQLMLRTGGAEVTANEIAQLAGVDPAMINYYFGSKSGLVSSIVDVALQSATIKLCEIEQKVFREKSIDTGYLLKIICDQYFDIAPIVRVLLKEVGNMKSETYKRYSDFGERNFRKIEAIVRACVGCGIYREDLDPRQAALTITCLTAGLTCLSPTFINSAPEMGNKDRLVFTFEELAGCEWIARTSAMLDRDFRT